MAQGMAQGTPSVFGAALRRHRLAGGLTQGELAARAGVSVRGISDLERGLIRGARVDTARMLADGLDLTGDERAAFLAAAREPAAAKRRASLADPPSDILGSLAVPPTPLIGRDAEVAGVVVLVSRPDVRLVTLVGPGGVGKTRLAAEAARRAAPAFDGVCLVSLAAVAEAALVAPTIATSLGLRETGGGDPERNLPARLAEHVGTRRWLLVLDNFEHVIEAATLVAELVGECSGLTVLVTSRSPLQLRAEREIRVDPLPLPEADAAHAVADVAASPAVALFVERAQAVNADFALTSANVEAVAAICRRLDGLPLAIELAAARARSLSPRALLGQLSRRLALLTDGPRDLPGRQRTMRDAVGWSYDLLEPTGQRLFRRLAVCAGCTLEAAEHVGDWGTGAVFDAIGSLVRQSLVRALPTADGEIRYDMLETVREYALEQLEAGGETAAARDAHARYYLELAKRADRELGGPDEVNWLARLETELDNFRAALRWALDGGDRALGLCLAAALGRFWLSHGHLSEGRRWLEAALACDVGGDAVATRAKALTAAGLLANTQGDLVNARALLEDGLLLRRTAGDDAGAAECLEHLATVATNRNEWGRATALIEECLTVRRRLGDRPGTAAALHRLGSIERELGRYERAIALIEQSVQGYRALGDRRQCAHALNTLGKAVRDRGDYARAAALHEESLALHRELGDLWGISRSADLLGLVSWYLGDAARATELLDESLALARRLRDRWGMVSILINLGLLAHAQGADKRAKALLEESLEVARALGVPCSVASLHGLGTVTLDAGDANGAADWFLAGLRLARRNETPKDVARCLEGLAWASVALGDAARAACLAWAAAALREALGTPLPPPDRANHERHLMAARRALGDAAFAAAWNEGARHATAIAEQEATDPRSEPGAFITTTPIAGAVQYRSS
jgi:predicted ATPase/transcriptional regulator with XRE-family HTH domain